MHACSWQTGEPHVPLPFLRYELSEFNEAHSVSEWFDSGIAISLDSDAYMEYESELAFKARKTAKATTVFVREHHKGKGGGAA